MAKDISVKSGNDHPIELRHSTQGTAIGMNTSISTVSASRAYMLGKNLGKAANIRNPTSRKLITGDEQEYGRTARKIMLEEEAQVVEIFQVLDPFNSSESIPWVSEFVVFKSIESGEYFLLELEKFHTQNTDLGFEYKYDLNLKRKIKHGAIFPKGTVFAQSARISPEGEWCPGIETRVALMSKASVEEDAIDISDTYARKVGVVFHRQRDGEWYEDEYLLLNLYGDKDNYQPFPLPGECVREDGLLFALRPRNNEDALVTLTKKALMEFDDQYDKPCYAPPGSIVMSINVITERYKNQSNNRSQEKVTRPHTVHLEAYETAYNTFYNKVVEWYKRLIKGMPLGTFPPIKPSLWNFIVYAAGNITVDRTKGNSKYTTVKRKRRNLKMKDWRLVIGLKQEVDAKVRFKMTGMYGNKATIGNVIPEERMPIDDYGIRAEMVAGNFPDFRRQIFGDLVESDINFVNIRIYPEIKKLTKQGKYQLAWDKAVEFYNTISPDYCKLVETLNTTADDRIEHLQHISRDENEFSAWMNVESEVQGVEVTRRLIEKYSHIKPTPVTFINDFGETIRTINPIIITSLYYLMLDKFGDDISSQSTPRLNIFGLPASVSKEERYRNFYRAQLNRNTGATEGRLLINQMGGAAASRALVLGNSPEILESVVKRILRVDNPFNINRMVLPGEEQKNYSLGLIRSTMSDFGLVLRVDNGIN